MQDYIAHFALHTCEIQIKVRSNRFKEYVTEDMEILANNMGVRFLYLDEVEDA